MNKGTIPRFITGKKLDIWDNSLICLSSSLINNIYFQDTPFRVVSNILIIVPFNGNA